MATVRVSSLPEIKVDRITDDDYYIVNDGDITTSKVAFKQMVLGIAERDIEFQGDIVFTGDVQFEGGASGPFPNTGDVYTKGEVDALIYELEQYDVRQDEKLNPLIILSGELEGSTFHRDFPRGIIQTQSTVRSALTDLEAYADDNRTLIIGLQQDGNDTETEIAELETRLDALEVIVSGPAKDGTAGLEFDVAQLKTDVNTIQNDIVDINNELVLHDGRITVLEADVLALKTSTTDESEKVASLIALSGLPEKTDDLGTFTGTIISDDTTVKSALQELETEVDLKAPIDNPVFTTKITAPKAANKVPAYYGGKSNFPSFGTLQYQEGLFAYGNNENAGYVSTATGWERVISYDEAGTPDRTFIFNMLGYTRAFSSEADAAANGVAIGTVYVYSATNSLANGELRTNMFTAVTP